jgi:hypothetical protein
MKTKTLLSAFFALVAVFMFSMVSAVMVSDASFIDGQAVVSINDIVLGDSHSYHDDLTLAGTSGETFPVRVSFTALNDSDDVKVKVEVYSGRNEYSDVTSRFNVVAQSTYSKVLTLQIPSDLDETTQDLVVRVTIYSSSDSYEAEYTIRAQRESYELGILSVDYNLFATAGDTVPVSVVITNNGFEDSDNGFVTVAIPALGVMSKAYFADLVAIEDCTNNCDDEDSVQKILYLKIPSSAKPGVYDVVVRAYNADTSSTVTQSIKVDSAETSNNTTIQQDDNANDTDNSVSVSAIVLTVLLVVIFVILLVALIILLTRKDKQVEEVETSYY